MFAAKHATNEADGDVRASTSATRASAPVTEAAPPPSEDRVADSMRGVNGPKAGDIVDGRYVLIEPLGKGGMGVVWKARSTALDVEVAVKLVRGSTQSAEAFKRMAREAHAAARLGHPAMATVLDFGATSEGHPYVVMELLRGESLGEVLGREGKVELLRAVSILLPIMDGLREAHDKGIVHRDIKPENLFISKAERGRLQPKVLDFGIAKLEQQTDSNTKLTQDGAVLGSPGYFSPEQARGQTDIDYRTDIWSISVVLYELITGELPFSGPNYNALLMAILKDEPTSTTAHGYGDEDLWRIIKKGLHRDREQRWASMWDLGRALARWLYDQGVRADVASRSLKEVWLEPRHGSEHAPPHEDFRQEAARPHALSTLVKLRNADTLAGETMSTMAGHRRFPTRTVGWAAAALSLGGFLVSVALGGDGPAASGAMPRGEPLAEPQPPAAAPASANEAGAASASPPARVDGEAEKPIGTVVGPKDDTPSRVREALSSEAKPTRAAAAKSGRTEAAAKPATSVSRRAAKPARKSRPQRPVRRPDPAKKRVDQEFGF